MAGSCTVQATQDGSNNYAAAAPVNRTFQVAKAAPAVGFTGAPATAPYQASFLVSATTLNAVAIYNGQTIAGKFVYTPAKGAVLGAGSQTLSVTSNPADTADYVAASASVTLQVNPATPKISWTKPASISYGTALSSTQLDATASAPGTFVYSPVAGMVLPAGIQSLSVTFTPTDSVDYIPATDSVAITITKATLTLTWATPAPVSYGTALGSAQLNAKASVPGSFAYSPSTGAIPGGGNDKISVTFTPTVIKDYATTSASVVLQVNAVMPTISWANPAAITYGGALNSAELDATATFNGASVAGAFVSTPARSTVLTAGVQILSVAFTPSNTANHVAPPSGLVKLQVNQATPKIRLGEAGGILTLAD